MRALLSALAFISFTAHADNIPAEFDSAKFAALMQTAISQGAQAKTEMGDYRSLSHLVPDDEASQRDYFSAVGGGTGDQFGVMYLSMVSESWKIRADGNLEADQWLWAIGPDGSLVSLSHMLIVERRDDGVMLQYEALPAGPVEDPAEQARMNAKLNEWYGFTK